MSWENWSIFYELVAFDCSFAITKFALSNLTIGFHHFVHRLNICSIEVIVCVTHLITLSWIAWRELPFSINNKFVVVFTSWQSLYRRYYGLSQDKFYQYSREFISNFLQRVMVSPTCKSAC
jgi:hypothetical protein